MSDDEKGLYGKYVVFKESRIPDGWEDEFLPHPEVGAFVLKPATDPAAFYALETYASKTDNEKLREDLLDWLTSIRECSEGKSYLVTCPRCGDKTEVEWVSYPPPGGIMPVDCSGCGYKILSESEGNPEPVDGGMDGC